MARFSICTQGNPPSLNPRKAREILIQYMHVTAFTVTTVDVRYDILDYHHTALRMPYFYWQI